MKKRLYFKYGLVSIVVVLVCLVVATNVLAASKSYNGLTTVTYNNTITDFGSSGWNGGYSDSTSPSFSMDQFGYNYWQTYNSCNYSIVYSTVYAQSNWYQNNVTSIGNGRACTKYKCSSGQTLRGHDYVQHYWQDGSYAGDTGVLDTSKVLTNP
jgi:hypothetical protein